MDKKDRKLLAFLCAAAYFSSYITRYGLTVSLAEMISSGAFTSETLSAAAGGLFIVYGLGQLVSGWLGDRTDPVRLITLGLAVSAAINLAIPFCKSETLLIALWCVNGFCQALIWPPMVRVLTTYLGENEYKDACVKVFWGSSLATIALYLISPVYIACGGWKTVFIFTFAIGILLTLLWALCVSRLEKKYGKSVWKKQPVKQSADAKSGTLGIITVAVIMICIVAMGMLRDGITAWMPVYIMETFSLSGSVSILTGVALPIFGVLCYKLVVRLYGSVFKNEMLCASVLFALGLASLIGLYFSFGGSAWLSVLLFAAIVGCMHGANFMLTAMVPAKLSGICGVAFISGLLNFSTYVGSAISTYGVSVITKQGGWSLTVLIWLLVGAAGTATGFISSVLWKKLIK